MIAKLITKVRVPLIVKPIVNPIVRNFGQHWVVVMFKFRLAVHVVSKVVNIIVKLILVKLEPNWDVLGLARPSAKWLLARP
jgi:hypothetical protein